VIEVNLLPGAARKGARRSARGGARRGAPAIKVNRWALGMIAAWVVGLGTAGWLYLDASNRRQEVELAVEQAVQDSVRYSIIIAKQDMLRARRDTIAQKLVMIQEVDAGRYIWAHLIDEISRALPDYTWIVRILSIGENDGRPAFELTGRTGNTFALTRFLKALEASPFIRGVQLMKTGSVRAEHARMVYEFVINARYEEPPLELRTTIPIQLGDN
jgi:Tfp pilus assembly protein PilN